MGENRGGAYNGILQRDRVENFNGMGYQYPPLRSHPTFQPLLRLCPKCFRAVLLSPPPDIGAEYCDDCVCLSASIISGTTCLILVKFLRMLSVSVARSLSGGVAICCVLPVLRITSCLMYT